MKKLCYICITFLIALTSISPIHASANIFDVMNMLIYIHEDGSATIQETWTMTMREGTENYRVFENMGDAYIIDFHVWDEFGFYYTPVQNWNINASREQKANTFGIVEGNGYVELCYGIGSYGDRMYTMQYTIVNFIDQYADTQGINWRFVSNEMNPKPRRVNIAIESDIALNDNTADIYAFGFEGSIDFTENGILASNIVNNALGKIDFFNIFIGFHDNYFSGANREFNNYTYEDKLKDALIGSDYENTPIWETLTEILELILAILIVIAFTFAGIAIIYAIYKSIRNKGRFNIKFKGNVSLVKKVDVSPFRDIPCDKNVFRFYYISKVAELAKEEVFKSGLLSAVFLNWIRNGEIEFIKVDKKGFLDDDRYSIHFIKDVTCNNDFEKQILGYLKQAAGEDEILHSKEFERWCYKNYKKIDSWFSKINKYMKKQLIEEGKLLEETTAKKFLGVKITEDRELYTAEFKEELYQVAGFKNFLLEFSSIEEKQVKEVHLWEDYLIFASIIGLADKVQKELGRLYPEFNQHSQLNYTYTSIAARQFVAASIYSSVSGRSDSSSRSSGGGGSSSFGGGGSSSRGGGGGGSR